MARGTRRSTTAVLAAVGTAAAGVVARRLSRRTVGGSSSEAEPRSRWRAVTVNRPADRVMADGRVPAPLAALGDTVEVEVRPAPGDKGTELGARLRAPGSGSPEDLRAALREAKQLIEVGEVLRVDPAPHGRRAHPPAGAAIDAATRHAGGEGVL